MYHLEMRERDGKKNDAEEESPFRDIHSIYFRYSSPPLRREPFDPLTRVACPRSILLISYRDRHLGMFHSNIESAEGDKGRGGGRVQKKTAGRRENDSPSSLMEGPNHVTNPTPPPPQLVSTYDEGRGRR